MALGQLTSEMLLKYKMLHSCFKWLWFNTPACCLCCFLVPCSKALIVAADQGPCSGIMLEPDSTNHDMLLPEMGCSTELNSSVPITLKEFQIKAQAGRWGGPEAGISCYLCWSCCTDLLPQMPSPWLPALAGSHPQGAQQLFTTTPAMESKGRKIKDLAFSGSLSIGRGMGDRELWRT